jgi:amino acid transporter
MAEEKTQNNQDFEVSFSRSLGLFDASMIGIGAMIGAGIVVLTGIAAGQAGPGAILAFALNGAVTLLTALTYAELASAFPETGGGYSFIKKAFPGPVGFASGWMLWFSYIVACALYALGFGAYFWEFVHSYFPYVTDLVFGVFGQHVAVVLMTALVCVGFVYLNAKGTAVTGKVENVITIAKILILMVFILFGLKVILGTPTESFRAFTPFLPKGFTGVVLAMGLTFIAFEGYDLIATVAEEIKSPEKNIPRATFISLAVAMTIYLLILFVCIGAIRPSCRPSGSH